jgi:FkbM family methyltransferase
MFYRFRKVRSSRRLDSAIGMILETPPLRTEPAPWCIASMVAKGDVTMYLLALKSFYRRLGRGKVAAIVDRDMPQHLRDTLSHHVPGIEFVILEDIETGTCQRGGTWERLLYVIDRSQHEYTIQLDADTLTVGDVDEVVACVAANRPFTMTDGFELLPLPEVVADAEATTSDYIGIVTEQMFARYPDQDMRYVRGSSGFAGFSRGGFTRAAITRFHEEMERLLGRERWSGWGTEQCGSNFAIANSPGAVVLPYPDYMSFIPETARDQGRFFHFIGRNRFRADYYAARGQEVIAQLLPGYRPSVTAKPEPPRADTWPLAFTRALTPDSAARYIGWRLRGGRDSVWLRLRSGLEFRGPAFQLRPHLAGGGDDAVAQDVFVRKSLHTPVRIPPERVKLIVDLGANVGMSCLYWLAAYPRAKVVAFEPHPGHAAQWRVNLGRNDFLSRATLHAAAAGTREATAWLTDAGTSSEIGDQAKPGFQIPVVDMFPILAGHRIDILKVDVEGSEYELLGDPRFGTLDVRNIVMEWHRRDGFPDGEAWCRERLQSLGFKVLEVFDAKTNGMMWAYRRIPPSPPLALPACAGGAAAGPGT